MNLLVGFFGALLVSSGIFPLQKKKGATGFWSGRPRELPPLTRQKVGPEAAALLFYAGWGWITRRN